MPIYRCLVHGKNFPGVLVGSHKPCGFYAVRFVEAQHPAHAEARVVDLLRGDEALRVDASHRNADARVFVEAIDEVAELTGPHTGFTFYVD